MSSIRRAVRSAVVVGTFALAACAGSSSPNARSEPADSAPAPTGGCNVEYPAWETSPYVLPFEPGASFEVGLDNCSSSFHAPGSPDQFAYDFDMDIGTPITAARGGVVTRMVEDQSDAGGGVGNLVYIDHGDGSVAVYLHFTTDGVEVEVGDEVEPGDLLGASGSSGKAGYPHLHFIVVEAPGVYPYAGLPVTFADTAANPNGPQQGDTVTRDAS